RGCRGSATAFPPWTDAPRSAGHGNFRSFLRGHFLWRRTWTSKPRTPFWSRTATMETFLSTLYSTWITVCVDWVRLVTYVSVRLLLMFCSMVTRALGLLCWPMNWGSILTLLLPNRRSTRSLKAASSAWPRMALDAFVASVVVWVPEATLYTSCPRGLPNASKAMMSELDSGGSER